MKAVVDNKTGEDFALSSEKQGQTQEFIKKTAHDLQAFKDKILAEQLEKRTGKKELKESVIKKYLSLLVFDGQEIYSWQGKKLTSFARQPRFETKEGKLTLVVDTTIYD
jgi:16S rRNA C967 or C1407 C5-methylase (RsmB/RsmF family)